MIEDDLKQISIPHLRTQFERGRPILFTGAGFSCSARNMLGENLPTATKLKETLWSICFAEMPFDPTTSLQDLYEYALQRNRNQLTELLAKTLSVDSKDTPDWYNLVFSLPWAHIYTLNIDDLERAVARSFDLPRKIVSISAVEAEGSNPDELRSAMTIKHSGRPLRIASIVQKQKVLSWFPAQQGLARVLHS